MKVGHIIYPYHNKDSRWYKRDFWDVLVKINNKGKYKKFKRFYNYESAICFSEIVKLKFIIKSQEKKA